MRTGVLALALVAMVACSQPSTPGGNTEGGDGNRPGCDGVTVTPGSGPFAWTVAGTGEDRGMDADPAPVGDGFIVGSGGCVAFVETSGRIRWTLPGRFSSAVRVGNVVVVAGIAPGLIGVDASDGSRRWDRADSPLGRHLRAVGDTVLVPRRGGGNTVTAVSARTGQTLSTETLKRVPATIFGQVRVGGDLFLTGGSHAPQGIALVIDGRGHVALEAPVRLFAPDPVGLVGDIFVVQSSGATDGKGAGEPSTHLIGVDRRTGAEWWRRIIPGNAARLGIVVGAMVVVRREAALTGLDGRTGDVRWTVPLAGNTESPLIPLGDDAVVVGAEDGTVAAIATADGQVRWSIRTEGAVARLGRVSDGVLAAVSAPGFYRAVTTDGVELWSQRGPDMPAGSHAPSFNHEIHVAGDTAATLAGLYGIAAFRSAP